MGGGNFFLLGEPPPKKKKKLGWLLPPPHLVDAILTTRFLSMTFLEPLEFCNDYYWVGDVDIQEKKQ